MSLPIEDLVKFGFLPTQYEGQEGTFYSKKLKAHEMPYFKEHIATGEIAFEDDDIVVEVCPNGMVQLIDQDTDYAETEVHIDTPEGMALLTDAGYRASAA